MLRVNPYDERNICIKKTTMHCNQYRMVFYLYRIVLFGLGNEMPSFDAGKPIAHLLKSIGLGQNDNFDAQM